MPRPLPLVLLLLALALPACGGDDDEDESAKAPAETEQLTPTTTGETGCEKAEQPAPKGESKQPKPKSELASGKTWTATFVTNCGQFKIRLDVRNSPRTASSFAHLARRGFFDDLTFHRVAPGFVVQGGDPNGDGTGGPGYKVVEAPPEDTRYTRGVVAMAKSETEQPGTSGSQFFVVVGEEAPIGADYAVLGKVVEGMEAIDRIAAVEPDPPQDGAPTEPIVISEVTIDSSAR